MISFLLTKFQILLLKIASCHFLLVPIPSTQGDVYAVKWVCND
jgi:hypothetical protein